MAASMDDQTRPTSRRADREVVRRDADRSTPTGLRAVLDVIPEHCYRRSTLRGLSLVARDLAIYGLAVWGLVVVDNPLLLVPLWLAAGVAVSGLFVIGHDAAHQALFDSARLNAVVARLTMLPSLHATELWVFGHNRVHHGHTLRQGVDFVWHPLTVDDFERLGAVARSRHRFEWSFFGAGAYYFREVWWNKMVCFAPPRRWRREIRRDQMIVVAFAVATLAASVLSAGPAGVWLWVKVIVVPFLIFCQVIGWVVHVHHISPEIRWWPRREWNRYRGQVEGTTILIGPPGWDFLFHSIMVHLPHHVDMAIPCYRLGEAADAIEAAFPDSVGRRPIRIRDYRRATRECKLHDFSTGEWSRYPG
jgi:acyl-lipid omega-6 desaturase (Delta-12 desaturase)